MKTKTRTSRKMTTWIRLAAIAGVLAGAGVLLGVSSIEALQRGMGPRWHRPSGEFGPGGAAGPLGHMLRGLDLADPQREAIRELMVGERDSHQDLRMRLFEARKLLQEAAFRGEPESVLNQLAQTVGGVETEAAFARARLFASIVAILEPEQRSKLEELHVEAESRLEERRERFRQGRGQRQEQ